MMEEEGDLNLSPRRRDWQRRHIGGETAALLAEDEKYFLRQALSTPCLNVLRRAEGAEIEDWQGRRLLDFHGNNVHHAGFGHPRIIEAITRQLSELPFCTRRYTNVPAIELAKRLASLAPGRLNKVLFAPGGSLAIGMALKLARAATGRYKTLSLWESFHGASLDAISIGGEAIFTPKHGSAAAGRAASAAAGPARLSIRMRHGMLAAMRALCRIRDGKEGYRRGGARPCAPPHASCRRAI